MKHCIVIIAFTLIVGCSEDSETTYTSIEGKWKFTITSTPISGNFEIVDFEGDLTINDAGDFKLKGASYPIDTRKKISLGTTPGSFNRFWLINTEHQTEVAFDDAEYSDDFRTITAKAFYYNEGDGPSNPIQETVVITRR